MTRERAVVRHLENCLQDLIQDQTGEIAIDHLVSLTNDVDEGVELAGEYQWNCDEALPAEEDDGIKVAEIFCGVGVAHIESHPEVVAMFGVEQLE